MRHLALLVALAALAIASPRAAAQAAGDDTFDALRQDFSLLYHSLRNSGGMVESDKPTVQAFLGRVDAFIAGHPDDARAVAMALQLAKWLDDGERIDELYARLVSLRPDDAEIAFSHIERMEKAGDGSEEEIRAAYEQLFRRFPDNDDIRTAWTAWLKKAGRYAEVIEILEPLDLDPAKSPKLVFTLADCLFAEDRFAEALEKLNSIPDSAVTADYRLRSDISRSKPDFAEYVDLWTREQEIRAAEAEADDLPRVELLTSKGTVVVELFENEAPNTVANFVSLADSGFYEGTRFHRYEPDFMIQGGDPLSKPGATGVPGTGDPGYLIPDENALPDHRNHFRDSLAMAKTSKPNSGGCQFYLNFRPTPWLNGKHTVFGRVIDGLDVVRSLRKDDEIVQVTVVRRRDHDYTPKTLPKGAETAIVPTPVTTP